MSAIWKGTRKLLLIRLWKVHHPNCEIWNCHLHNNINPNDYSGKLWVPKSVDTWSFNLHVEYKGTPMIDQSCALFVAEDDSQSACCMYIHTYTYLLNFLSALRSKSTAKFLLRRWATTQIRHQCHRWVTISLYKVPQSFYDCCLMRSYHSMIACYTCFFSPFGMIHLLGIDDSG